MKLPARWLLALLSVALLAYPFLVYVLLQHVQAAAIGTVLFVLVVARYFLLKGSASTNQPAGLTSVTQEKSPALKALLPLTLVGVASGASMLLSNHPLAVRLNPVWMSLTMLAIFGWSLYSPPSMIERFARLAQADLPPHAIGYTRQVTKVWCIFFVINAAIALWTALWAPLQVWTLYNGLISYLLMGLLFGVEYLVRRLRQRQFALRENAQGNAQE